MEKINKKSKIELCNYISDTFRDVLNDYGVYTCEKYHNMDKASEYYILHDIKFLLECNYDIYEMYFFHDFITHLGRTLYIKLVDKESECAFTYNASVIFNKQEPLFSIYAELQDYNFSKPKYINNEYEEYLTKLTYE